jgi:glutamate synthase domain-containing protein 1
LTTTPVPFATTPPPGLPELREHDACALAAFATKDGLPSHDVVERAVIALDMMVHRAGSVDGEGDGSGIQVDIPRPLWAARLSGAGHDAALADDPRFVVAHVFFEGSEVAEAGVQPGDRLVALSDPIRNTCALPPFLPAPPAVVDRT